MLECLGRGGLERRPPVQTLVDDGAQAPQVRLGVVLERHDHLGGHVHGGSAEGGSHVAVLQEAGKPEVGWKKEKREIV